MRSESERRVLKLDLISFLPPTRGNIFQFSFSMLRMFLIKERNYRVNNYYSSGGEKKEKTYGRILIKFEYLEMITCRHHNWERREQRSLDPGVWPGWCNVRFESDQLGHRSPSLSTIIPPACAPT